MDNGNDSVTEDLKLSASDRCRDNVSASVGDYTQASDKIIAPRFHLLTRPSQTESFPVPVSTDRAVGLPESLPLQSEHVIVQEFPYEGLQEGLYDLADPSVNLHEFIVSCLASPKDRLFLFRVEKVLVEFIEDTSQDLMEFPTMTSYHRMLLHRVAAYFGLEHNVSPSGLSVIVSKAISTRMPKTRFAELLPSGLSREEGVGTSPKLILKRNKGSEAQEKVKIPTANRHASVSGNVKKSKTMAEREADYEKARARIFSQPVLSGEQNVQPFDKETQQQVTASNVTVFNEAQSHHSRHSPLPFANSDHTFHMTRQDSGTHIPAASNQPQLYKQTLHDAPQTRYPLLSPQTSGLQGVGLTRLPTADFNPLSTYTQLQHPPTKMQYPQHMVTLGNESLPLTVHPMLANQVALQQAQMMALLQAQQHVGFPRVNMSSYPGHDTMDSESEERGMSRQQLAGSQRPGTLGAQFPPPPAAAVAAAADFSQQQPTSHLNQVPVHMSRPSERPLYSLQQQQQQQFLLQQQHALALEQFHQFQLQQYQQQKQQFASLQHQQLPYRPPLGGLSGHAGANRTHSPSPLEACADHDTGQPLLASQKGSRADSTKSSMQGNHQQERRDHPVKAYSAQRPTGLQSVAKASGQAPTFPLEIYEIQTSVSDVVNELRGDGADVRWRNVQSPANGGVAFFKSNTDRQAALNRVQQQPGSKYKLRLPGRHLLQSFSNLSIT